MLLRHDASSPCILLTFIFPTASLTWCFDNRLATMWRLQNLEDIPDIDRPLLSFTSQQMRALLEEQGIQVGAQPGTGTSWPAYC